MKQLIIFLAAAALFTGCAYDRTEYTRDANDMGNGPGGTGMFPGTEGAGVGSANPGGSYGTGVGSTIVSPAPSGPGAGTRPNNTDVTPANILPEPAPILPNPDNDLD